MIKNKKILAIAIFAILIGSFGVAQAQDSARSASSTDKNIEKVSKVKTAADKQLEQRIENLGKLKDKVSQFKNISDNDKVALIAIVDDLASKLNILKNNIELATSTAQIKEIRDSITDHYRIYMLINPELQIIASADRIGTMISMMNIIGAKLETRLSTLATSTEITSANITSANKALADLKSKLTNAQTDVQEAIKIVQPLMPDQGDKTVMEANLKALKDARAKIKSAQNNLSLAKKNVEAIMKIIGKEKKNQNKPESNNATSTQATTTPASATN